MAANTLLDNCIIVMGQSPPGDTCNTTGVGFPLLNGPTEYGSHHPTPVQYTSDARKVAQKGDLLFCVRGSTTGRMNWADREYAIGRGVAAIRHKTQPDLQPFVRAVIECGLPALMLQATGSTFPNVSAGQLGNLWWPPLSINEQQTASHFLGCLDDRIVLLRETNTTLEAIGQALFKSWFVDFNPVKAKAEGREPEGMDAETARLFPDKFVESELGTIPMGWQVKRLGDLTARITKGTTPTTHNRPFVDAGINFVKVESIADDGSILPDKFSFIDEETHGFLGRSKLESGDVLITIAGTIGRVAIVTEDILPANTNQAVAIIRPITNQLPGGLIRRYLLQKESRQNIYAKTVQAVQANLSLGSISDFTFCIPSQDVILQLYHILFRHIDDKLAENIKTIRTLSALRDTLLPRLLTGQIRVGDAEQQIAEVM